MLNAVLFDLDNTLIDRDRVFRECINTHFGDPAARMELYQLDGEGRGNRAALFSRWEQLSGTAMNQVIFGRMMAAHIEPDKGLLEALGELSSTVKLGIITNGGADTQRRKFQAAGLGQVIPDDQVWVSDEVGKAKPDPAIFLLASGKFREAPENCLFVGDDERDDLAGATAAGMRARLVDAALDAERLNRLLSQERGR